MEKIKLTEQNAIGKGTTLHYSGAMKTEWTWDFKVGEVKVSAGAYSWTDFDSVHDTYYQVDKVNAAGRIDSMNAFPHNVKELELAISWAISKLNNR